MRRFILTSLLVIGNIISVFSQINTDSKVNIKEFPRINFVVHDRNPDSMSLEKFSFRESIGDKQIVSDSFDVVTVEDTIRYKSKNKTVLVLFELLVHESRIEQNFTFRNAFLESLDEFVNEGDKIQVCVFALKDENTNILKDVTTEFTDDIPLIKKSIDDYEPEDNDFTDKPVSDIYGAIIEGVEKLENLTNDFPKSILLLSEEKNNSRIANSVSSAISLAKEKDIAIYTIKYNRSGYHQFADPTLSKKTYGLSKVLSFSSGNLESVNKRKSDEAKEFIISSLNNSISRAKGMSYLVSLDLINNLKDGNEYILSVNAGDESIEVSYKAPGNWVIAQFQKDIVIASVVSVLVFIVFILLLYLVWRRYKSIKFREKEKLKLQRERELEQEERINEQNEELTRIKSEEDKRKRDQERREEEKNNEAIIKDMLKKGSFPILKYNHKNTSKQFEINKPILKIGRDKESNDISIANNNISRNHFSIRFKEGKYTIIDNNSLNGILVNGRKVKETTLKNADIIDIADINFRFYE